MQSRTIVVGVDGSEHSKAALRWAVEEAKLRGSSVRAVHVWWIYPALYPGASIAAADFDDVRAQAGSFVEQFVAEVFPDGAGVDLEAVAIEGEAAVAPVLVDAAKDAELLVVGSRGLGGFRGLLLGSVSQQCTHYASCPVVVLHDPAATRDQAVRAAA